MIDRTEPPKWKKLILPGILLIVIISVVRSPFFKASGSPLSPLPDQPKPTAKHLFQFFTREKSSDDLIRKIKQQVDGSWNDYSVVVQEYGSGFSLSLSEGEIFVGASVNKVPILAALYYYANKGDIDLDKVITLQADDIQDYGTGSIRYAAPGTVYSVKTLAKLMIKQSDNTAAYILANHIIGIDKLTAVVSQWGLIQTDMANNKTSNQDIAKLFRMIYDGKISNPARTQEMLSFLKDSDYEKRLPGLLPKTASVYHKIGTEVGNIHDAGIVTDGTLTYYIGIFTSGTAEGDETDALFATLSKTVYDYLK